MECGGEAYCQRVETLSGARATQCVPLNSSCLVSCGGEDLEFEQSGATKEMQSGETITANACPGQTAIYSLNVQQGEGVRVSAVSDSQSLSMGMSIWMNGVDFWSTWDSKPQTVFELPCAQADLRITTKLWPWRGIGRYQIVTEKLIGGCRDECIADALEALSSVELVTETIQYEALSLCGLDTDGFEFVVDEGSSWGVLFNELSDEETIDVRVLSLPHFGNVRTETVRQGDAMDLSDLALGTYRLLLSATHSRSVARYSVEFLRRVEVE